MQVFKYPPNSATVGGIVTVQATDLDIRDLDKATDSVTAELTGAVPLPTGAATEASLASAEASLASIAGEDFATETTLAELAGKDFATEATLVSLEGKDFATETTLAALANEDFATESTLAAAAADLDALAGVDYATEATLAAAAADLSTVAGKDFATEATLAALASEDFATETTLAAMSAKLPSAVGQKTTADSLSVTLPSDQGPLPVSSAVGRASVLNVNEDISALTTAAYVEIEDSTTDDINWLSAFESSGNGVILATGASSAEVDVLFIPPGGFGHPVSLAIPTGTRLSIKALLADVAGDARLVMNLLK